jgi:phosphoribosylaminoimidazolecarboxamide formyltransferase / IMP cyclohydrolase
MTLIPIRRALISVSDKTGLIEFATALAGYGIEILSTGGTARVLRDAGLQVRDVSEVTGFPEMMDGRLKTLHPRVHGGLLAQREDPAHLEAMQAHGIGAIDLLVVNLYPFSATVAAGAGFAECIENIDIGGPAMIRSAAKNHAYVTVAVDSEDYAAILAELAAKQVATSLDLRKRQAAKAFACTAAYDAAIGDWMAARTGDEFPARITLAGRLQQTLRYGENPHQKAAFYIGGEARPGIATAAQIQGKELSYNNLNDTDAAFELVAEFDAPAVAIIKHANPCGVAAGADLASAYLRALACDPVSAFGGIIACNRPLDAAAAEEMVKIFTEVIIAPDADQAARGIIASKKNLRLLLTGGLPDPLAPGRILKSVSGGFLMQGRDNGRVSGNDLQVVSKRAPTTEEVADMLFAFTVCKHVKSNAIVYVKDGATVGIGAGQMNRLDSARIAARKAEDVAAAEGLSAPRTRGCVVASDAFFPFADGLLAAAEAGRHRGHSAGRLHPRRRGNRCRRCRRARDGVHTDAPLPALIA